jgi:hypothetical protein
MEHIILVGSEDVSRAASSMSSAASDMIRASSNFEGSIYRLEMVLENFLTQLQIHLENHTRGEVKS